jgi:hypothetical protein
VHFLTVCHLKCFLLCVTLNTVATLKVQRVRHSLQYLTMGSATALMTAHNAEGAEGVPLSPTLLELATTVNSYTGALPVSQEMLAAVKLALQPWSPQTHRIHAPKHRACVRSTCAPFSDRILH